MVEQVDGAVTHVIALILIVSFFLFFVIAIIHWVWFDRLVRLEYEHFPEEWEKDGGPAGFFWRAPGKFDWLQRAKVGCMQKWLKETPDWIA